MSDEKNNEQKHMKEPWSLIKEKLHWTSLLGAPGTSPDNIGKTVIGEIQRDDDAQRIVECVNACAGFSTKLLSELNRVQKQMANLVPKYEGQGYLTTIFERAVIEHVKSWEKEKEEESK